MKSSNFLISFISTILFSVSVTPAFSAIPKANLTQPINTPAPNLKADWWNDLWQPGREMADPYFDNIWYASLYPEVKEDIDNNYSGGNRYNQYMHICNVIAQNQGIRDKPTFWVPVYSDIASYIGQRAALVVKEENGTVNCYSRELVN